MSGRPNEVDVLALKGTLRTYDTVGRNIIHLEKELAQVQASLENARESAIKLKDEINHLLKQMDVHSPANYGFEERYLELMVLMSTVTEGGD